MHWKYLSLFLFVCNGFSNSLQYFLPLQENAESVFYYEIIGTGQQDSHLFGFDSKFNLHIIKNEEDNKLLMNITQASGKIGRDQWSNDLLSALEQPFNLTLNKKGAPIKIEYNVDIETNYTMARKDLILKQIKEIYNEYKKYVNISNNIFVRTEKLPNMPFGKCETKTTANTSLVYFTIDYEARADSCKGEVDPFFTLDMNVPVHPQSDFLKTFGFTLDGFIFQYVRLDARIKLESIPEIDVQIYTMITFNSFNSLIEEDETTIESTTNTIG